MVSSHTSFFELVLSGTVVGKAVVGSGLSVMTVVLFFLVLVSSPWTEFVSVTLFALASEEFLLLKTVVGGAKFVSVSVLVGPLGDGGRSSSLSVFYCLGSGANGGAVSLDLVLMMR